MHRVEEYSRRSAAKRERSTLGAVFCSIQERAEESGRTESTLDKQAMKEVLSELFQEVLIFRSLSVGTSSHPASAVLGPSTESDGVKAVSKSSKCDSVNSGRE